MLEQKVTWFYDSYLTFPEQTRSKFRIITSDLRAAQVIDHDVSCPLGILEPEYIKHNHELERTYERLNKLLEEFVLRQKGNAVFDPFYWIEKVGEARIMRVVFDIYGPARAV